MYEAAKKSLQIAMSEALGREIISEKIENQAANTSNFRINLRRASSQLPQKHSNILLLN